MKKLDACLEANAALVVIYQDRTRKSFPLKEEIKSICEALLTLSPQISGETRPSKRREMLRTKLLCVFGVSVIYFYSG